jgi:hypothetical protein
MDDVEIVQSVLDCLYDRKSESMILKNNNKDMTPLLKQLTTNFPKLMNVMAHDKGEPERVKPILQTPQHKVVRNNPQQILEAIAKRNLNPPKIHILREPHLAEFAADKFMEDFIDEERFKVAMKDANYKDLTMQSSWYAARDTAQRAHWDSIEQMPKNWSTYPSHLKPLMKFNPDGSHTFEMPAAQVLTVMQPEGTISFAGGMQIFTKLLQSSLKDKWCINNKINARQRNGHINKILTGIKRLKALEVDFSKFDKSQERMILMIVLALFRRFNIPEEFIENWDKCHQLTKLIFHIIGIMLIASHQRRSGDVGTFILNTVVAMVAMSMSYSLLLAIGGIFGGDDMIIWFIITAALIDQSQFMAEMLNLSAKIEIYPGCWYFSSHFIVQIKGTWYMIPDPMKAIVRLGREDLQCGEHVRLYWESYADNFKIYQSIDVRLKVAKASALRLKHQTNYPPTVPMMMIFTDFLASVTQSRKSFEKLFFAPKHVWDKPLPLNLRTKMHKERTYHVENLEDITSLIEVGYSSAG